VEDDLDGVADALLDDLEALVHLGERRCRRDGPSGL
jgi:hypothetical protein